MSKSTEKKNVPKKLVIKPIHIDELNVDEIVLGKIMRNPSNDNQIFIKLGIERTIDGKTVKGPVKLVLPILPTRMWEIKNPLYSNTTRKTTITIARDEMSSRVVKTLDSDGGTIYEEKEIPNTLIIEKIKAFKAKVTELVDEQILKFIENEEGKYDDFEAVKWAEGDADDDIEDLLFFYKKTKDGSKKEDADKIQKFSTKNESHPNKKWLWPKVNFLQKQVVSESGELTTKDWPKVITITDPTTKEKKEIKTTKNIDYKNFLNVRTHSSCLIIYDDIMMTPKGKKMDQLFLRATMSINSIADLAEKGESNWDADFIQDAYGNNSKVSEALSSKLAKLSDYTNDDESSSGSSEKSPEIGDEQDNEEKDSNSAEEEEAKEEPIVEKKKRSVVTRPPRKGRQRKAVPSSGELND